MAPSGMSRWSSTRACSRSTVTTTSMTSRPALDEEQAFIRSGDRVERVHRLLSSGGCSRCILLIRNPNIKRTVSQ